MESGLGHDLEEILAVVTTNLNRIKTLQISYDKDTALIADRSPVYLRKTLAWNLADHCFKVDERYYKGPERTDLQRLIVQTWDTKKSCHWDRVVTGSLGKGVISTGTYSEPEDAGSAVISGSPNWGALDYLDVVNHSFHGHSLTQAMADGKMAITNANGEVRGRRACQLRGENVSAWIDRQTGSVLSVESYSGRDYKNLFEKYDVVELASHAEAWLPMVITHEQHWTNGYGDLKETIRVVPDSIGINGDLASGSFNPKFPSGCVVSDTILGRVDVILADDGTKVWNGSLPEKLEYILEHAEKQIRK